MSRIRLPNRRAHELRDMDFNGKRFVVGFGQYDDGRIAELFIDTAKPGATDLDHVARDAAVSASLGLQSGVDIETLRAAVSRDSDGGSAGLLGAALDLIAAESTP
jgi:hypothetical protein